MTVRPIPSGVAKEPPDAREGCQSHDEWRICGRRGDVGEWAHPWRCGPMPDESSGYVQGFIAHNDECWLERRHVVVTVGSVELVPAAGLRRKETP